MLIMFFIYKEQAFTLPVWGLSTLAVSTDWEEKGSGSGAGAGAVSMAAGAGWGAGCHPPNEPVMMSAIAFRFMKPCRCLC